MNLQKDETTTRQKQEQCIEGKDSPQILERAMTTSRIESLSASIATSMGIQQKNTGTRKRKKPGSVSNVTKRDTLQRTVKGSSQ